MSSGALPIPESSEARLPETPQETLDQHLSGLRDAAAGWAAATLAERVELLADSRRTVAAVAPEWVAAACASKRITLGTHAEGEEWQSGPWALLRTLRLLERSVRDLAAGRLPRLPAKLGRAPSGQVTIPVFPTDNWDRALFTGISAAAWAEPGLSTADVLARQASAYRGQPPPPTVSAVLGAGNIASIAPLDALSELFVHLRTVALKMNPVNEYLGPVLERGLAPLIRRGVLRILYGGVEVGQRLTTHPQVDHIHMTGSDKTHDAILFGSGPDGAANKAAGRPITDKTITAELGNVSPVIVVPGPWSDADVHYQARNLSAMLTHNAGFNCVASRLLVQPAAWAGRSRLLDALASILESVPTRHAYYPGAADRLGAFLEVHPTARRLGHAPPGALPWTLVTGLDPADPDEICFSTECFTSLLAEVGLAEADPARFLDAAVDFCNARVWGSLGVTIMIHPKTAAEPSVAAALDRALVDLRYGSIGVNQWTALGFVAGSTPWGPFPGHPPTDIQSGTGLVHNTYLLDGVQKTVMRGQWRAIPKPTWFPDHRTAHDVLRELTFFEAEPSMGKLGRVMAAALRG